MSQSKSKDLSGGRKRKVSYRDKAQRDSNRVVLFDRCAAIFEVGHSRDLVICS
jgi:hypothetical protein